MSENEHESLIKTPKQLIMVVVLAFVVPVLAAALLAYLVVTGSKKPEQPSTSLQAEELAKRIKPVAEVTLAAAGGGAAKAARTGDQIVQQYCAACHATGAAGAPKTGDKAGWSKRLALGLDGLLKSAIAGKNAMPPRGGAADVSDFELARAIVHLANQSGGSFKEPAAPAGAGK
jgi:cytochrome c5